MQIYIVKFVTGDYGEEIQLTHKIFSSKESAEEYTNTWNKKLIEDRLHYNNFDYYLDGDTDQEYKEKYGHYIYTTGAEYKLVGPFEVEE